jgi:predicted O-methyltransferase YrrM
MVLRIARLLRAIRESGPRAVLVAAVAKRRGAKQKLREFARMCRFVRGRQPRIVVEIGTMRGGTLWAWCRLAAEDALIVSIDLPGGDFGGGYDKSQASRIATYSRRGQRLHLIRGDSHAVATLSELKQTLSGRLIDLLFIDGDHTYEGVKQDYAMYAPLVTAGGMIAFHDILPCRPEDGDVHRLWEEIKSSEDWREFVAPEEQSWRGRWGGIGVLIRQETT